MQTKHPEYQYLDLLKQILDKGFRKVDRGTGDASYSIFGPQMRFDLSEGFPLLTTKKVFWKGVVEELYWFMSGQSNVSYLTRKGVHIWDDYPYKIYSKKYPNQLAKEQFVEKLKTDDAFAKEHGELPKIYGELWRRWPTRTPGRTVDQLGWAVQELKDDPNAHNLIVNSWNPEYLYTMATNEDAARYPICHNMYQFNVIDDKLSLHLYQRSADMFLGVPFNIASYALLTMILAQVTGYKPGEFIHSFGDTHIYEKHLDAVKEQLQRTPNAFPRIELDPSVKSIDDFKPELVKLIDYKPHDMIKAELSVSGGLYEKKQ
ncbi:MAG: thymidylate synthase [Candidatus Doudnabacteria bacterium RIFCSPLOWO2_02_FULL_42_9]|uniref:Thymidylate synthase n=1 Tax=Candidatus Doudnabacteria bacterium RIFCSPHIGHO2_01_FULL_41_86 TaxID=1817821 RepID=A0A1F5N865_9BACT|nr:MAG: thymidylate synthase [Candidatus Doudnabacteria bacterium RIFCSPHIGHO2_01_FULL_41_86]OGE75855.1 MAG: thymidylate synthase [Candidatus Doudnabacteria bacterium RIFCSPHIGHO2_01_43_10]OGE86229.1 MAG: thymidylate synthase [Candidatus Doudnabacteria bacterium RIFCSPHIGHO2_12_FULL_42_22]OGE87078.1 MAG: thymidylate synthase [Candidatus Doudnabacteria bacterium RIFCSPHIGHO2_02_FULL_42_25]OGE92217.1 MAG: thymidylate synthase [Candidatus Doudnabacteria bacterium RIFCSPLOWO2_01_FULL_42_60]OGE9293